MNMEQLRNEVLHKMQGILSDGELGELSNVLDRVLYKYHIEIKTEEIVIYDNSAVSPAYH